MASHFPHGSRGNEPTNIADVLEFMVDDPETHSSCVSGGDLRSGPFSRARPSGAPGKESHRHAQSRPAENTARLASAHTGALVAMTKCSTRSRGSWDIRVDSYEEAIATATMLEKVGPVRKTGVAALPFRRSGEILSDLGPKLGVSFPPFSGAAKKELETVVASIGQSQQPARCHGYRVARNQPVEKCLTAIAKDDNIGVALCIWMRQRETNCMGHGNVPSFMSRLQSVPVIPPLVSPIAAPSHRTDVKRWPMPVAGHLFLA